MARSSARAVLANVLAMLLAGCGGSGTGGGGGEAGSGPGPGEEPQLPTLNVAALELQQAPPGSEDRLVASAGAVVHADKVAIYGDKELKLRLRLQPVSPDGSFETVSLGDNQRAQIWLVAENADGTSEVVTFKNDIQQPAVYVLTRPADPTAETSAEFDIRCDQGEACEFFCSLDGSDYEPCSSPARYADLEEGRHQFSTKAVDPGGNTSDPKDYSWTIDFSDPMVIFETSPAPMTNDPHAGFTFVCSKKDCTFECSIDGSPFGGCVSPANFDVTAGDHAFAVRATSEGRVGQPNEWAWTVDLEPPVIELANLPAQRSSLTQMAIEFACANGEACTFTCSLDGSDPAPCTSGELHDGLARGSHTFEVTARDGARNESSESYSWEIASAP